MKYAIDKIMIDATGDINHLSSNIFFHSCPYDCPYCFNKHIDNTQPIYIHEWEISAYLAMSSMSRHVCLMGGEPTIWNLRPLRNELNSQGYGVILFTANLRQKFTDLCHHVHYDLKLWSNHADHNIEIIKGFSKYIVSKCSFGIVAATANMPFMDKLEIIDKYIRQIIVKPDVNKSEITGEFTQWITTHLLMKPLISTRLFL